MPIGTPAIAPSFFAGSARGIHCIGSGQRMVGRGDDEGVEFGWQRPRRR